MESQQPQSTAIQPPMIESLEIKGLFGIDDVRVEFTDGPITIVFGPNGIGKSTVLRTIAALVSDNPLHLRQLPLAAATLRFADGSATEFERNFKDSDGKEFDLRLQESSGGKVLRDIRLGAKGEADRDFRNYWVHHHGERSPTGAYFETEHLISRAVADLVVEGTWQDEESLPPSVRRRLDIAQLEGRVPARFRILKRGHLRPCVLINTERLRAMQASEETRGSRGEERVCAVEHLCRRLASFIIGTRSESKDRIDQISYGFWGSLDARLKEREEFSQGQRQSVEEELRNLITRLHSCALAPRNLDFAPSDRVTSEALLIYECYLEELKTKTEESIPALQRLETLQQVLNDQFEDKSVSLDEKEGMVVTRARDGARVGLDRLSSGEQHLLVLTYKLLFDTKPGGICLIDEPEISFHTSWQRQFVDNLARIAEIAPQQFVIATHSPMIIGPHTDMLRPIERTSRAGTA